MLRIGVIFGGSSSEREVSLEGGRHVFQRLDRTHYDPAAIFVTKTYQFWKIPETLLVQNTTDDLERLLPKHAERLSYEELPTVIDFAFVVGHGKYMEDGCLQGLFELLGIPYNGPGVLGAALGSNKYVQRRILKQAGIDVPNSLLIRAEDVMDTAITEAKKTIGFPCVVKPTREGCSTAITKAGDVDTLRQGIHSALQWDTAALVEEYIDGREVTVSVVGNEKREALPVTETPRGRNPAFLTLEDKFLPGGAEMITPARLDEELTRRVQETAVRVCDILHLIGYPRIDMFVVPAIEKGSVERLVVLESNTLPGITPSTMIFHQAAEIGMTPPQYLHRIIELGLDAHRRKKGPL